nr:helix-turn-helix domain-containing protein [Sinorhizobium sp. BG8]
MGPGVFFSGHVSGTSYEFVREASRIARTGLDLILIEVVLEGGEIRTIDGKTSRSERGDVCVIDLARPTRTQTAHNIFLTLAIPRQLLFAQESQMDGLHGMLLKSDSAAGRLIGSHFLSVYRVLPDLTQSDAPAIVQATADLVAQLVSGKPENVGDTSVALRGALIVQIKDHIDKHLSSHELGPEYLSKTFGLSRASLYRLFEPIGGVTEYIRSRRLRWAFDALADGRKRTIGEIAYSCGFTDVSVFSRAFRNRFGISPSEARGANGGLPAGVYFPPHAEAASVHEWLRIVSAF